jgi:transcriptional regulator with XRE-family HTH domain
MHIIHFCMHDGESASELMREVDVQRRAAGLTQEAFAPLVGMTQGHYSKLVSGKVEPGPKATKNLMRWLDGRPAVPPSPDERGAEMRRIAAEITMQCMRLTELAARS